MLKLLKVTFLGAILLSTSVHGDNASDLVNKENEGNPVFAKYKKYGFEFPARFSDESSGKKVMPYQSSEEEQDYQEFARLMKQVMEKSNSTIQDADDFQKRFQLEKQGKAIEKYSNPAKGNNYQEFKKRLSLVL